LISQEATEAALLETAKKEGFTTLLHEGVLKVSQGITTLEELNNVVECGVITCDLESELLEESNNVLENVTNSEDKQEETKTKILIVDDEPDIRKILVKRLENAGYDVVEATNGQEGIALATKESPEIILMDIMMPVMNGIDATREIRSQLKTASIPIIMLTAKKDKQSELEGIDVGADDYITKPFDHDKLLARIGMLLRRTH
jgi:CheY-like chemotaxis protein